MQSRRTARLAALSLALLLALLPLRAPAETPAGLDAYNGKRIGVAAGTTYDAVTRSRLPDAVISYFNNLADLISSLRSGKIDAFPIDEPIFHIAAEDNPFLDMLPEYLDSFEIAPIFPKTEKGEKLCGQFNEFLRACRESGSLEALQRKWLEGGYLTAEMPDVSALSGENGTIRMVMEVQAAPFTFVRNNTEAGYELELVYRFCEQYGYRLSVQVINFDAILPAVQSGKADMAASMITVTEERAESVLFSDPHYATGTVLAVLKKDAETPGFFAGLLDSFERTFLREARWELFLEGVLNTLIITLASVALGTLLGFLAFMACRKGKALPNRITRFATWLVQGMPAVVLLMILYYVVFGSVDVSGIAVAVLAFTLTFGASVLGMLRLGVGAMDRGQTEAALALGYSDRRSFFRVILPQALPLVIPSYKAEIVGLMKATAIVGYIAVPDLTRMGDIVRSRTYEAFFPLIAVTVIYFVMEMLLAFAVSRLQIRLDPKRRSRGQILKGVTVHDPD